MSAPADIAFSLGLSLRVAAFSTILVAFAGLPLAYILATREFRGKSIVDALTTLPLVLPPVVTGYYLLLIIGQSGLIGDVARFFGLQAPRITFTWVAAVLASFAVSLPFTVRTARAAFESVDRDLIATSRTLGRSELATGVLVTLPLALRGVLAGLALSYARALGEFGATVMVAGNIPGRTNTMPLEIYNATLYSDWSNATMLVLLFTVVSAGFMMGAGHLSKKVVW